MSFITKAFVRRLSVVQRAVLIEHVAGAKPVVVSKTGLEGDYATVRKLIDLQLVRGDHSNRPRFTMLTDAGREVAAILLAEYADALVAAGCLEPSLRPLDLARMLANTRDELRVARTPARRGKIGETRPI
jgi:hypothetical protein